jgi:hypothetical protein
MRRKIVARRSSGRSAPNKYHQRRPEKTVLYRVIEQHLESFLEHAHESSGKRLPKYVENEFRRYLECGLRAHGFARAVCETCGDDLLLPFCRWSVASSSKRSSAGSASRLRPSASSAPKARRLFLPALRIKPQSEHSLARLRAGRVVRAGCYGRARRHAETPSPDPPRSGRDRDDRRDTLRPLAEEPRLPSKRRGGHRRERGHLLEDGRICYRIKDTDQARLMTPTQFLARLAALVPPPRHPLVRF